MISSTAVTSNKPNIGCSVLQTHKEIDEGELEEDEDTSSDEKTKY